MKKKLFIIISSCILGIAILVVGSGLYINANIEELTRKHLGAKIKFEDVGFHYSPMPTVVFSALEVQHGKHNFKVPSLKIYPDLMGLIKGNISLRKIVMEDPVVLADFVAVTGGDRKPSGSSVLTTDAIPAERIGGIMINRGKLMLSDSDAKVRPVSFTVAMDKIQKKDQTISVQLKTFSVDEIGLKFAGNITISSFSPLKLKVDAPEASLNPAAVKDFLVKFGFVKADLGNQIPKINSVESRGMKLEIDPDAGKFYLSSETLSFDKNLVKNTTVTLLKEGAFELKCAQILLDMGSIHGWLMENPKGKEAIDKLLVKAKLKELKTEGKVELSSLDIKGTQQDTSKLNGSLDLKTEGLKIHLVSEKGEKQDLTVSQLVTKVTIKEGKPSVQVGSLQFDSSRGGSGKIVGSFETPLKIKDVEFKGYMDSLRLFETTLNLDAVKKGGEKSLRFDFALSNPSLEVLAKGLVNVPRHKETHFQARLAAFRISRAPTKDTNEKTKVSDQKTKDFDLTPIKGKELSGEAFIKTFQFNDLPELEDVKFTLQCRNDKAIIRGSIRVCDIDVSLDTMLLPPRQVVAQVEGRGANLNLTSLIACFSKKLPVFLAGRISLTASLFAKGANPKTILDTAEGEVMVTLNRLTVHKLSNLDYRLAFFLDIVGAAGIGSIREDSIRFSKGVAKASLKKGKVVFNTFSLRGPLLSTWGNGEFSLKDKRLRLSGQVQTALGITKDLSVDRVLEKRET